MHDSFASFATLSAFVVASFVLAVTPGPGVFYIVTRSATEGRAAGLASVAGVALGNLGNASAASIGLAALFAISSAAFLAVKYLGAAYLIYLGLQALRSRAATTEPGRRLAQSSTLRRIFVNGCVVALLNPKTALFFAAFLPQFLPHSAGAARTIALGGLFVLIAATTDTGYAMASGTVNPWLRRSAARDVGRYLGGGAYLTLGVVAALTGPRTRI